MAEEMCASLIKQERALTQEWFDGVAAASPADTQVRDLIDFSQQIYSNALDTSEQYALACLRFMRAGLAAESAEKPAAKQAKKQTAAKPVKAKAEKAAPVATAVKAAPVAKKAAQPELDLKADDLKQISGVGPALEKKLIANGVTSFKQIAAWNDADIAKVEADVFGGSFAGRIKRDDWIGQARALMGIG
jgi:predicted flap endonuclease-1-like 5' DNA nuclease